MAPTHAATAELAFATVKTGNKKLPMTVQSAVRMAYNKFSKQEEAVFTKKVKERMGFGGNIVVLDEVSMLSTKDYNTIIEASQNDSGNDIKIIFMGDIQQIPQVTPGSNLKKQVSKAFTEARQLKLTEVKRTDSNSILSVLTSMRENATGSVAGMIPQVENTESLKYLSGSQWNKEVVDSFTSNPEGSIFIAYQNSAVAAANQKLRGLFNREGDLQKGDVIVGYLGYSSKQIENQDIANSIRYTVDGITKVGSIIEIDASSSKLKQLVDAGVSGVEETATGKYYQLSMSDSFTFEDLTAEDFEKNNKSLSRRFKELYDAKQRAIKSKSPGAWRSYYATASEVSKFFSKALVGSDYIYNPETDKMESLGSKTSHAQLKRNFPELVVEKSVDFGHAITIHKSQGTTVDNVFFDASTLPQASPKLLQGETVIGTERHSLAYVGISRASKKLIVESGNPSNFYPLDSQRSSQNVVKPKGRPGIDLNDKDNCG